MKLDKEIIFYFKEWQKEAGEYSELDIEAVDFKLTPLDDFITFSKGKTPKYSETLTTCKVIKSGMAKGKFNNFNLAKEYFLDMNRVNSPKYLEKGDLLLNTTGKGTAGRVTLYDLEDDYVTDSHITTMKIIKNKFSSKYLLNYFISFGFKNLESMAEGSGGQVELKLPKVKALNVLIPGVNGGSSSLKIQEALIDFIEHYKNKFKIYRDAVNSIKEQVEMFDLALLPAIFSKEKNSFVTQYFDLWAKKNGFELSFKSMGFREMKLEDICDFPALTRIKGKVDLSIYEYQQLSDTEKEKYSPLISATLKNNQITGYVHESRLSPKSLSDRECISWTRINGKHFFLQESPVVTGDDSFIMHVHTTHEIKYVRYATLAAMYISDFNWSKKAGKTIVKNIDIRIPNNLNGDSKEYQARIVEFIENWINWKDTLNQKVDDFLNKLERAEEALIAKVYKGTNDDA